MESFHKVGSSYINLSRVDSISVQSEEHLTLHAYGDKNIAVSGDDARAILARLRDEPEQRKVNVNVNTEAAQKAQELAKTLGGSSGRRFDFTDSQGATHEAVVYREGDKWVAYAGQERFEANSEPAAMSAAMGAA